MSSNYLVSVIIPTYNRAHLLDRAVRSVLNQTYQNFEIIIIDDGSTDNTKDIIGQFEDDRIQYICQQRCGASSARNRGIEIAKGEYIGFLDSDDQWLPQKLEKQIKKFQEVSDKVGVVFTNFWIMWGNRKILGKTKMKRGYIYEDELFEDHVTGTTILVKRECFDKIGGFDEKIPARQDYDLCLRISKYYHFDYVKEPVVNVNWNSGGRISVVENRIEAALRLIEKIKKETQNKSRIARNKIISNHYFYLGVFCWGERNVRSARRFFMKAIKIYPFRVECWAVLLMLMVFGKRWYNILFLMKMKMERRI
jgi:glycosyltransferase involved in cell wall biosynthesis